jgi:hypothetical protein
MKTFSLLIFFCIAIGALRAAPETQAPVEKPFRLVFKSYDGDPKADPVEKFSFQIETIDRRQPSEFLKLGEQIPNTKFKLLKFVFKEAFNPQVKEMEDVSELTVVNVVTGKTAVLTYNKVVDVSAANTPGPASK